MIVITFPLKPNIVFGPLASREIAIQQLLADGWQLSKTPGDTTLYREVMQTVFRACIVEVTPFDLPIDLTLLGKPK